MNSTPIEVSTPADSRAQWLAASGIWIAGGFLFPFLTPIGTLLSGSLQRYFIAAGGMSDEMAFLVAFTVIRIPLTAVLATVIAAAQCVVLLDVRPRARHWILAGAVGACISTLIFLPSGLVALRIAGSVEGMVRISLLVLGAFMLGGLACLIQRRFARGNVFVPGWFIPASALAAALGVLGSL